MIKRIPNTQRERLLHTKQLIRDGVLVANPLFIETSIPSLLKICNGCGSASAIVDLVPDHIINSYIGYACSVHDFDYHEGETKEDKKIGDTRFKKNLKALIKLDTRSRIIASIKYAIAYGYYFGVKRFGSDAYWEGKIK